MARSKKFLKAFQDWLRLVGVDLLLMICLSLATLILSLDHGIFRQSTRVFPMRYNEYQGWYGPTDISYPERPLILSNIIAGVIFAVVPIAVILAMQVFVRSFWDANAAILGLVKGLVIVTFIQTSIKEFLGVYRPFFLEACQPNISELDRIRYSAYNGPPRDMIWVPVELCRNKTKLLKNALQSYPSGHTATIFTVMVFLSLYLNAKFKAFADFNTGFWKMLFVIAPVMAAVFASGTLFIDGNHHARDIILTIPIGLICGILSYRAHYYSAFSYLTNHIPLPYSYSKKPHRFPFRRRGDDQSILEIQNGEFLAVEWPRETDERAMRDNSRDRGGRTSGLRNVRTEEQPSIELGEVRRSGEEAV